MWHRKKKIDRKFLADIEEDIQLAETLSQKAVYKVLKDAAEFEMVKQWCYSKGYAIELDHTDGKDNWYKIWGWD